MLQHAKPFMPLQHGGTKESTSSSSSQGASACAQAGHQEGCSGASVKGSCHGPQDCKTGCQGLQRQLSSLLPSLPHQLQRGGSHAALANAEAGDLLLVAEACFIAEYCVAVAAQRRFLQVLHGKRCQFVNCRLQGQAKRCLCRLLIF